MAEIFYTLCTITAAFCAFLLLRAYRRSRYRLLLWGGLCFVGLTFNNALLVADLVLLPQVSLFSLRLVVALFSVLVLLFGLVWEER